MNFEDIFLIGLCSSFLLFGCAQNRSRGPGGQLMPCPGSPNCVSSQSVDEKHRIEPFPYSSSEAEAMSRLKEVVRSMKRARIVEEREAYFRAEFRSALFRFVDDVEFQLDDEQKLIHVRSASRTGYWDLGVNRRRVETIRSKLSGSGT